MGIDDVSKDLLDSAGIRVHQPIQPARSEATYLLVQGLGFGALPLLRSSKTNLIHL
jgi:hypothetical protein